MPKKRLVSIFEPVTFQKNTFRLLHWVKKLACIEEKQDLFLGCRGTVRYIRVILIGKAQRITRLKTAIWAETRRMTLYLLTVFAQIPVSSQTLHIFRKWHSHHMLCEKVDTQDF